MASPCCWGPSGGLAETSWRDTAGQAAVRLLMELSMTKGRLQEQEEKTRKAEEQVAAAEREREAHRKTLQQLHAAELENETLLKLIQKHEDTMRRVETRERELYSETDGTKSALKGVRNENEELRREVARLAREKAEAEHLAGQIADALDAELSTRHDHDADIAAVEARLREAQMARDQLAQEKQDLQRSCNRMIRDLKAAKERTEEAAVKERSASVKLGKAAVEANQMQKRLDAQARENHALLSEKLRLHEEIRSLQAGLSQRDVLICDLRQGLDSGSHVEAEKKSLERRSVSVSGIPGKASPRTPSAEHLALQKSLRKVAESPHFVDKRCSDGQLSARSVEVAFESGKVGRSAAPVAAAS